MVIRFSRDILRVWSLKSPKGHFCLCLSPLKGHLLSLDMGALMPYRTAPREGANRSSLSLSMELEPRLHPLANLLFILRLFVAQLHSDQQGGRQDLKSERSHGRVRTVWQGGRRVA